MRGLDDLDSSSSLRMAEHDRGSGNSRSSDPTGTESSVPRDNSKIFKVIDLAQVCMLVIPAIVRRVIS